jgi:hypothetical protein
MTIASPRFVHAGSPFGVAAGLSTRRLQFTR